MHSKSEQADDILFMERAITLALEAEAEGNLPIGAVLTLDGETVAEGKSELLKPAYSPGRHAEMLALAGVPTELWPRATEMTCYTTLEPCVMCFGALLLHGVGRVVFGATDVLGGGGPLLPHLPGYYETAHVFEWHGPVMPEVCDELYRRADLLFAPLPVGRGE